MEVEGRYALASECWVLSATWSFYVEFFCPCVAFICVQYDNNIWWHLALAELAPTMARSRHPDTGTSDQCVTPPVLHGPMVSQCNGVQTY